MNAKTRFLSGGLAAVAVASAVTLVSPSAYAADLPAQSCGQPAVPAVWGTIVHPGYVIPAVTHDEWRWERTVTTRWFEYRKVVTPAHVERDWARDTFEFGWTRKVVTQDYQPAVPGTDPVGQWEDVVGTPTSSQVRYEYEQKQTGDRKWEADGWNGEKDDEDKGKGWSKTGNVQQWVVTPGTPGTPEVPEISHTEHRWSVTSPGPDWTATDESQVVPGATETTTTIGDAVPAGDGWELVATRTVAEEVLTTWALSAPDGYTGTGFSDDRVTTEQTAGTSATAPGPDWTEIPGSRVVQTDTPAVEVAPVVEAVLVEPGVAATPPCPTRPQAAPIVVDNVVTTGQAAGPKAPKVAVAAAHHGAAAVAAPDTVLPATGSPVSPLLLTTGIGALLAGTILVRTGRKRSA